MNGNITEEKNTQTAADTKEAATPAETKKTEETLPAVPVSENSGGDMPRQETPRQGKRKRRFPVFWTALLFFTAACAAALMFGLSELRAWLADYESVQPKYEAQKVFDEYFADPDYGRLLEITGYELSPFEDRSYLEKYLHSLTDGTEITYTGVLTGSGAGEKKYAVRSGGSKFAEFTIAPGEKTSVYGYPYYELTGLSLFYNRGSISVGVTVPDGMVLYINGKEADASYITESGIETESCRHMPEGVSGITFSRYEAGGLLYEPELRVTNASGTEEAPLTDDTERGGCRAQILYSDTLRAEYSDTVITAAEKYAAFMQMDGSYAFLKYFEVGTELYNDIKTVAFYFVWDHDGYEFEDVNAREFYAYDENTFSCRVSFVHVLHKKGMSDYRDYIDITFYLRRVGDTFLIYDRYNN